MDTLINRLIDVDKQARRRVAAAKKARAGVVDSLNETRLTLTQENEAKYQDFVQQETAQNEAFLAKTREEEARRQSLQLSALDAIANENHRRWVDEIVEAVTK